MWTTLRAGTAAIAIVAAFVATAPEARGVGGELLRQPTIAAFDRYVGLAESRVESEVRTRETFLYLGTLGEESRRRAEAVLRRGQVFVDRLEIREQGKAIDIPDGLVHHWVGIVFIRGARVNDAVRLLQDYDRHAEIYAPAVQRSKVLARDGEKFRVFLRFYQKKGIAVTVDSEHEAEFLRPGEDRVYSRIRSTRIAEVANAGEPGEREKPVGNDGGYLWRLNTYWRFLERDEGTYIQCESVTLTRDIPFGLGWLVGPFVRSIPRESLVFTMERTRKALSPLPASH